MEVSVAVVYNVRGNGGTGAIAPVPLFQGGAPLQSLFHLFLVNFAYILHEVAFDLNYSW